ncbi:hypothetical protein BASA81_008650 [Batrachochytrium salamandrivorans]|nr:hypothetical protein BASA81_008650 [Batrachochytrium salamandrivorans]
MSSAAQFSSVNARAERALRNNPLGNGEAGTQRSPNWLKFVTVGLLSKDEQQVLSQYERQSPESVQELLDTENTGEVYAQALLKALGGITEPNVAEYLLELVGDFLAPDFAARFVYFEPKKDTCPDLGKLLRLLESDSALVRDKSAALVGLFLSLDNKKQSPDAGNAFVTWCVEQLRALHVTNPNHSNVRTAVFSLSVLLQNDEWRSVVGKHGGMKFLNYLLNLAATKNVLATQMVYEVCLVLWLITLTRPQELGYCEVSDLVQLLSDNRKEKINRIVLAVLTNLIKLPHAAEWYVQFELGRILGMQHRITDLEMLADVGLLQQFVSDNLLGTASLTVFDMYKQEVASGKLKASKTTHAERFWKENVRQFEQDDFAALKQLVALVQDLADNHFKFTRGQGWSHGIIGTSRSYGAKGCIGMHL